MNTYQATFALSVNAASALLSVGVPIRKLDPVTREVENGKELARFWFEGNSPTHGKANSLLLAYSIIARGKHDGRPTAEEVINIVNNPDHIFHTLHKVLELRDQFHQHALQILRDKLARATFGYTTVDTNEATAVSYFSKEIPTLAYGDEKCIYTFQTVEAAEFAKAYEAAWAAYILPQEHPFYYAKASLENRTTLLRLKYQATPVLVEHPTELKTVLTPLGTKKADFDLARRYL